MIINKFTSIKDLEKIEDGEYLKITKDIALNFDMLEYLLKTFPKSNISIMSGYDRNQVYTAHDTLYTEEETKILAEHTDYALLKYNKEILFDGKYTVEEAIVASRKIDAVVNEINKKKLSPFEKFLYAYDFVTSRIYNEESWIEPVETSRNLIEILNGDKIVCVGYANMLCTILSRLNIPCTTQTIVCYDPKEKDFVNHMVCLVRMEDPKYKISGIYQSDPTEDAMKSKEHVYGNNSFSHALNQLEYVELLRDEQFIFDKGLDDDEIIHSFEEAEFHSKDIPVRMAHLFPEKTQGKNQIELIVEDIENKLKQSKIQEKIESFIDGLNEETLKNYSAKDSSQTQPSDNFESITNAISNHIISKEFFGADFIDEHFATMILNLIKNGSSLDDIKQKLKLALKSTNLISIYLEHDEKLLRYSKINNNELYTGYDIDAEYDFFHNTPYEEDFYRLCDNATFVSSREFYRGLQKIFIADGFDFSDAGDFASQMLRRTEIINPKHLI